MKTYKTFHIGKLSIDFGWFPGEDWRLVFIDALHYSPDAKLFTVLQFAIGKLMIGLHIG